MSHSLCLRHLYNTLLTENQFDSSQLLLQNPLPKIVSLTFIMFMLSHWNHKLHTALLLEQQNNSFFFWPCWATCKILDPRPGIELVPPAVEV